MNRSTARFNDSIDRAVLRPVARAYQAVTPAPLRLGVSNFFNNISEPWWFVNNLLQLKFEAAADTLMRFSINTVFGIGGLGDVASQAQISRHRQDFGQTLAWYGVGTGPYLVLPLLGPSTLRDSLTLPIATQADLLRQLDNVPLRNSLYGLRLVDTRANLLRLGNVLDEASLDPYSFQRDVFLQLRDNPRKRGQGSDGSDGRDDNDGSDGAESALPNALKTP